MSSRRRLDVELVRRELVESRERARSLIEDGVVTVNGAPAAKPARQVLPGDAIEIAGPGPRFVGRGGDKLDAGLDVFGVDVIGARAIDVGSSTGGFTDALLQRGAASVIAVDVGRAQLHERLRADDRVDVREQTDIRSVDVASVGERLDVVVVDVSFIGLDRVLSKVQELLAPEGDAVVLVKPQFEAGKAEADRGRGVITDPVIWRRVLGEAVVACSEHGLSAIAGSVSPLKGGSGNVEFLFHLRHAAAERRPDPVDPSTMATLDADALDALVADAGDLR